MATSSIPLKQCSRKDKCCNPLGSWLPATPDYFSRNKRRKDGLDGQCKACVKSYQQSPRGREAIRRTNSRPEAIARRTAYNQSDKGKAAKTAYNRSKRGKEYRKEYWSRPENKARKQKRVNSKEYKRKRREREATPSGRKSILKSRRKLTEQGYFNVASQRRKARKQNLPDDFTLDDWNCALEYFFGCCAVCGRQLNDLFGEHTAAMDHWIPLSSPDCPGTIPTNIVPLCHGVDGCNNSKHKREPLEWLKWKFGKSKAKEINQRIQAFFCYVKTASD